MGNPTAKAQQIGHHMAPFVRSPSNIVTKKQLSISTKAHSQTKTRMKTMELSHERFLSNAKCKYSRLADTHQRYKKCTQNCMKHIGNKLKASLIEIDPHLQVSCLWIVFSRAYYKEFSLAENYPKGHGAWFHAWLKMH